VSEPKICPRCGTPQQWNKGRHCACGFDFGSDPSLAPPPGEPPADPSLTEPGPAARVLSGVLFFLGACCVVLAIVYVGCAYLLRGI